jgi:preprotein translocase subunit SecG
MVILWMVSTAFISTSGLIAGIFLVTASGDDADVLAVSGIGTIVVSIYFLAANIAIANFIRRKSSGLGNERPKQSKVKSNEIRKDAPQVTSALPQHPHI